MTLSLISNDEEACHRTSDCVTGQRKRNIIIYYYRYILYYILCIRNTEQHQLLLNFKFKFLIPDNFYFGINYRFKFVFYFNINFEYDFH